MDHAFLSQAALPMKIFPGRYWLYLVLFSVMSVGAVRAGDQADDLAIIVHPANKLENVTFNELQRYFKVEKSKTPDGLKLVVLMQDVGRPERDAALKGIYKMTDAQYTSFFVEATFTGAVTSAPKSFPSAAAIKKFVSVTPGAIGYVRGSDLDDTIKVIKVDGKAPGDADYQPKAK
jgi:hypothetical protein